MRHPVHVVYGGAQLFKADTTRKLGRLAERLLAEYAPDAAALAGVLELPRDLAPTVYARVVEKLTSAYNPSPLIPAQGRPCQPSFVWIEPDCRSAAVSTKYSALLPGMAVSATRIQNNI